MERMASGGMSAPFGQQTVLQIGSTVNRAQPVFPDPNYRWPLDLKRSPSGDSDHTIVDDQHPNAILVFG